MTEIRIYVEGHTKLRSGFHEFFKDPRTLARKRRIRFQCIPCGAEAIRDFCNALRRHPDAFNVLLLDSDGDLTFDQLKTRADWKPPHGVTGERVHWMVEIMESWFLADRQALRECYGARFRESALPQNLNIEQIPKVDVLDGLKKATDGAYHKVTGASKILERLNPRRVREQAPHCRRLFDTLLSKLAD